MTIIELIKLIKPIPELYIRKHSIFCLKAFIDGWCYRDIEEYIKEEAKEQVLYTEFYEWLRKKYDMTDSRGWADILYYKFETEEKGFG